LIAVKEGLLAGELAPEPGKDVPPVIQAVMKATWAKRPEERITMQEICKKLPDNNPNLL
jgi:hypothetical protein